MQIHDPNTALKINQQALSSLNCSDELRIPIKSYQKQYKEQNFLKNSQFNTLAKEGGKKQLI